MVLNKSANDMRSSQHNDNCYNYRSDHHSQFLCHPYCCNNRIKGKDNIKENNLDNDRNKCGSDFFFYLYIFPLKQTMYLMCPLKKQKQPAAQQNEVTDGKSNTEERKEWSCQTG